MDKNLENKLGIIAKPQQNISLKVLIDKFGIAEAAEFEEFEESEESRSSSSNNNNDS